MDSWCITADTRLSEHSKALQAKLGHAISFAGKWDSFISHPSFTSKAATEQQKIFVTTSQSTANTVVNNVAELCADNIIKSTIIDRFHQIVFQFDPTNSISADSGNYSKHYIVQQQGSDLVVTINLAQYGDALHSFKEKIELVLDVRTDQDKRDARQALDKLQDELRTKLGFGLYLDVDYSFTQHYLFLSKTLDERTKIFKQIYQSHFQRITTSTEGIIGLSQDDIMKRTIQGRISNVVLRLDPSNSVASPIGGNYAKHYETTLQSNTLFVTMNMEKYGDTLYNFKDKIEVLLNVRVEQDKRDTQLAIEKLVAEVNKKLGFFIDINVDWEFTTHTSFTSKPLDEQTKMIKALYATHLPRILNSGEGLPELAKDSIMKTTIQSHIGRVIITFNPNNTIDSPIGGNYAKHYETILQGANLVVNINMDKYGDTLYNFKDKIEVLLNVRVEQEKRNAHEALEKIATELKAKIGFYLGVQFDWQFTEQDIFKSKSLDDQSKIIKQVYVTHAARVLTSNDGLATICKDDIMRNTIESQVCRVVFSYDTNNKVESPIGGNYAKHYETILNGKNLVIRINMDKYGDTLYNFKDKIDVLFNVRVEQEKSAASKPIKDIEQSLNAKLGFAIELGVDWIFTHHSDFTSKPLDEQSKIIKALYQTHLPRIMTSGDGLADLAKDETIKEAIRERIRSVHATYDAENRIASNVGGNYGKHYELLLQGFDLYIPINLRQYSDTLYSFKEKMEVLLNVRTEQEKRAAKAGLKTIMDNLAKTLGFPIDIDVDWKFTNHSDFTSKSLDDQSKIIRSIHQTHLPRVLTSGDGLVTLAKDELVKRTVQDQVKQVLFLYDPDNQVNSSIGGNYGKHYDVTLSSCVLMFTVNMKQFGDTLYSSLEKIETSLNVRIAKEKREALKALPALQSQLSTALGEAIELEIDWSFTLSGNFLSKPLDEYSRVIQSIWKTALPRLVTGNESIPTVLNQNNEMKTNALPKFRRIIYCVDFNDSVNSKVGDKNWEIKLQSPVLRVNVNLSQFNITFYNTKDKLIYAINNPETVTGDLDSANRLLEEQEARKAEQDRRNKIQFEEDQRKKAELEAQRAREIEEKQRILLEERKRDEEERARRLQQEQEQERELERIQREQKEAERSREIEQSQKALLASQRSIEPLPVAALMPVNNFATPSPQPSMVTPTPLPTPMPIPTPTPTPTPVHTPMPTPMPTQPSIPVQISNELPVVHNIAQLAPIPQVKPEVIENPLLVDVKRKIAKECDEFAKKVVPVTIVVNWDAIINHSKLVAKSDYEKKRFLEQLANICAFVLNRNTGLAELSNDSVIKQAVTSRIRTVEIAVDFDDTINDNLAPYAHNYSVSLDEAEGTLKVTVNAKAIDNSLPNLNQKIELLLNTRVDQEIFKSKTAIKPVEERFKNETGISLPIEIDFTFTKHNNFIEEGQKAYSQLERYSRIISQLYRSTIPSFVMNSNESLLFKCKDEIIKEAVASRFNKIVFTYDPENKIVGENNNANYYELVSDSEGALRIIINMNKFDSNLYYIGQKLDRLLNVRLAQDKRTSYKTVSDIEARFKKDVGFDVKIDIDWSFATHERFTKEDLDWRSARISRLAQNTITAFLFNASDNVQLLCKDAMIKAAIQEHISNIVFTYSPENKVDDKLALGVHEKFYSLELNNDTKTLLFTMNLDKYDSSLYNLMHKMKELLHLFDDMAKRSATQKLREIRESFIKDTPPANELQVQIDWSFLGQPEFAHLNGTERERLIVELSSSYASRVLRSVGLDGLFKDQVNSEFVVNSVKTIEFTYDPENKVNAPYNGNQSSFYQLTYQPDSKLVKVTINLSAAQRRDNMYHFMEKLDDLLCFGVRAAQFKAQKLFNDLSAHLKNSFQVDIAFTVDYDHFILHHKFLAYNASQRATCITQLASNMNSLWRNSLTPTLQHPRNGSTIKNHLKHVSVTYDCDRDTLHDLSRGHIQKYYTVDYLMATEQLAFKMALAHAKENMNYMKPMVDSVLDVATAQYEGLSRIARWEVDLSQKCGQPMRVEIDWSDLHLNKEFFDKHDEKEQEGILNHFLTSTRIVVDTVFSIVRVYPNCQQLFTSQINTIKLIATVNSAPLRKIDKTLVVTDGFNSGGFKDLQNSIEYLLDISIPLWKYRMAVAFLGHASRLSQYMPDFSFEIDWTYLASEEFRRLGCNPVNNMLNTLSDKFGKALVKCLESVCAHPVSLARVGQLLKKVIVTTEDVHGHYQVKFASAHTAVMIVLNKQGLVGAMESISRQTDLKDAIEDLYGLIVDIALHDTVQSFIKQKNALEAVFGKAIAVDVPTAFLSSDNTFISETPHDRSKYIRDLFNSFCYALLSGLTMLGEHPTSKDIVIAKVDSVLIELQPSGRGVQLEYDATKKQIIARPALNQLATKNREWKYDLLPLLEAEIPVLKYDISQLLGAFEKKFNGATGFAWKFDIDWDTILKHPEFVAESSKARFHSLSNLSSVVLDNTLLGPHGIKVLLEIPAVKSLLHEHFTMLTVHLDSNLQLGYEVLVEGKQLILSYSWHTLFNFNVIPKLKPILEAMLNLRPIVERHFVTLVDSHLAQLNEEVKFVIDKDIDVIVDWQFLLASPAYQAPECDYQRILREKVTLMPTTLIQQLTTLAKQNLAVLRSIKDCIQQIIIRPNPANDSRFTLGDFTNPQVGVSLVRGGAVLMFEVNLSAHNLDCTLNLQWVFTPRDAQSVESDIQEEIDEENRRREEEEEEWRQQQREREFERKMEEQERNQQDLERKMKEADRRASDMVKKQKDMDKARADADKKMKELDKKRADDLKKAQQTAQAAEQKQREFERKQKELEKKQAEADKKRQEAEKKRMEEEKKRRELEKKNAEIEKKKLELMKQQMKKK